METALDATLSEWERSRLTEMEAIVEAGLRTFLDVGIALVQIRGQRLYRETHQTFEQYCADRWGISRPRAYELMEAATVATMVSGIPDTAPPTKVSHATELARLGQDSEAIRDVWSGVYREHGPKLTAAQVKDAVDDRLGIRRVTFKGTCYVCNLEVSGGLWHCDGCGDHRSMADPACGACGHVRGQKTRVFVRSEPTPSPARVVNVELVRDALEDRTRDAAPEDDDEFNYGYFAHDLWLRAYRETHPKRGAHPADEGIWFEEMDPAVIAYWSEEPSADGEYWRQFAAWANRVADALNERTAAVPERP